MRFLTTFQDLYVIYTEHITHSSHISSEVNWRPSLPIGSFPHPSRGRLRSVPLSTATRSRRAVPVRAGVGRGGRIYPRTSCGEGQHHIGTSRYIYTFLRQPQLFLFLAKTWSRIHRYRKNEPLPLRRNGEYRSPDSYRWSGWVLLPYPPHLSFVRDYYFMRSRRADDDISI